MKHLALSALAALLGAACSLPSTTDAPVGELPAEEQATPGTPIPVVRLRADPYPFAFYSGMSDSTRVVARDTAAWRGAWSRIWLRHSPEPALPAVNFASEMVVVASLGERTSGGFAIYVDSAYQHAGHVEVVVRKVSPGGRCGVTAALTQPVDVARLPATTLPVLFREKATARNCG